MCRFGLEQLGHLLAATTDDHCPTVYSMAAVAVLDFVMTAIGHVAQMVAADLLGTATDLVLRDEHPVADSTTSAALVALLLVRFSEQTVSPFALDFRHLPPSAPSGLLPLLPSSRLFLELLTLDPPTEAPTLSSTIAVAKALLPRRVCFLRAAALAASQDCAVLALATWERQSTRESDLHCILDILVTSGSPAGLMAAARLVSLSCHCPSREVITRLIIGRFLGGQSSPPTLRTSAACLIAACLSVRSRRDLHDCCPSAEQCCLELSLSDLEAIVRSASLGLAQMPPNSLIVLACSIGSAVSLWLGSNLKQSLPSQSVESLVASLVDFMPPDMDIDPANSDHMAVLVGQSLLPTLTRLIARVSNRWPSGLVAPLRSVSLVSRRLLGQLPTNSPIHLDLSSALCRLHVAIMAADLARLEEGAMFSTATLLIANELVSLEAIACLLVSKNAGLRQAGAVALHALCEVAGRCDLDTLRGLVAALSAMQEGPEEVVSLFVNGEKLENLLMDTLTTASSPVALATIRSISSLIQLLRSAKDKEATPNDDGVHVGRQLAQSPRIWQRIVSLAKRIQAAVYSLSVAKSGEAAACDLNQQVFAELAALFDLVSIGAEAAKSESNPDEHAAAGVLPVVVTTLLTLACAGSPSVSNKASSFVLKRRPWASSACVACLRLCRTLTALGQYSAGVPACDLHAVAEIVARFLPDLLDHATKSPDPVQPLALTWAALKLLVVAVVSSPRGLARVFCVTRLPVRLATRLLSRVPSSKHSPSALDWAVFGGKVKLINERIALLRLLGAAALLWPHGHELVMADAAQLYMPLLNQWAGLEHDAEASKVLSLLARRGKTARRLGLQASGRPKSANELTK